jgi:SAM-dependent methyltransferase
VLTPDSPDIDLIDKQLRWVGPRLSCDSPIERDDTFVHNELVLTGWALSPVGVSGVIVQIDDRLLHASYGLDTPWLAESLPDLEGSDRAGYRLQIDTSTWVPGRRRIIVTVYDQEGGRDDIAGEVEVVPYKTPKYTTEDRRAAIDAGEIAMWLERPAPTETGAELQVPVEIAGWAYARSGVEAILVTLDERIRHEALHPVFRPDLVDDHGEEVARRAGFLLQLHPRDCAPGWHHLSVVAVDGKGQAVGLETDFLCVPEPPPTEPSTPGEPIPVDWLPEPRPVPPRPATTDQNDSDTTRGPLREAERDVRYRWAAQLAAGRSVLDIGDGRGEAVLREAGARDVTEVHVDEIVALSHDDASFDLVTCFDAIEQAGDADAALEELRRVLRPDGVLVIAARRRAQAARDDSHRIPGGLQRALRDRFANVRVERQQTLLTSVIADDEILAMGDGTSELPIAVRKLGDEHPGGEDHALAMASDGELPELPSVAMLAASSAVRQLRGTATMWQDRALLAEADAAASRNQADIARTHQEATLRESRDLQRELVALGGSLAEARAEFAKTRSDLTEVRTQLDERAAEHATLLDEQSTQLETQATQLAATEQRAARAEATVTTVENSLSWRITRPLRAVKRGVLRMRRALRRR